MEKILVLSDMFASHSKHYKPLGILKRLHYLFLAFMLDLSSNGFDHKSSVNLKDSFNPEVLPYIILKVRAM